MARRAALDEKPFRPLDAAVLRSVLHPAPVASMEPGPEPSKLAAPVLSPVRVTPPADVRPEPDLAPKLRQLDQEKRILFTREETQAIDRLVTALAARLNTQVKVSHVMRAATLLLLHAEGEIVRAAAAHGPMTRPPNGDMAALQRFERVLAVLLDRAVREALPLRD